MLEQIKARIGEELERLGHELNVILPKTIQKAVEHGDLSENAEYKFALERQQFVQARIGHLAQRLSELAKIDVKNIPTDRVGFGSRVTVRDMNTDEEITYTIVSGDFIDLDAGHISLASPIGKQLIGHSPDDVVDVQLPRGTRRFKIVELVTLPQMVDASEAAAD